MPITAITGSASGIGAAVSAALRTAGHQVIGIDPVSYTHLTLPTIYSV